MVVGDIFKLRGVTSDCETVHSVIMWRHHLWLRFQVSPQCWWKALLAPQVGANCALLAPQVGVNCELLALTLASTVTSWQNRKLQRWSPFQIFGAQLCLDHAVPSKDWWCCGGDRNNCDAWGGDNCSRSCCNSKLQSWSYFVETLMLLWGELYVI